MLASRFRLRIILVTACLFLSLQCTAQIGGSMYNNILAENATTLGAVTVRPPPPSNVVTVTGYVPDYGGANFLQIYNGGVPNFYTSGLYIFSNKKVTVIPYMDPSGCRNQGGDPIVFNTGAKIESYTDFALPGEMGLKFVRYYNTGGNPYWTNNFNYWLDPTCLGGGDAGKPTCHQVTVYRPDGSTIVFSDGANDYGTYTTGAAALTHNADGTYTIQDEDTLVETYSAAGQIQSLKDVSGIGWTFSYPSGATAPDYLPSRVTHTDGQYITLSTQGSTTTQGDAGIIFYNVLTVTDPAGNVYTYNSGNGYTPNAGGGDIAKVTFPGSPPTYSSYKYVDINTTNYDMLSEVDYNGVPYSHTSYYSNGWASGTYLDDNSELTSVVYGVNGSGVAQTTITNPLMHTTTNLYGGINGQLSQVSDNAVSDCGSTVNSRVYDANGNLFDTTDNNGNVHTYNYAVNGQLQAETEAYGQPEARTTNYVWDPNVQLNRLTSATTVGWSKTAYTYNAQNRLASVTVTNLSANGIANQALTTSYNYLLYANGIVQTMSVTQPSANNSDTDVTTYDVLGNVTSVANGLGQTTTYGNYTALGQPQQVVGPNGDITNYTYDARSRLLSKTTHPNGTAATWNYSYDGFGLLLTETTPDGEVTTWNRDAEMRVRTIDRNDKDGASTETFGYDAIGHVNLHTIARGTTVTLSESVVPDALGRVYQRLSTHGQTITYGYDGNGNVLSVTNAAGHLITYSYDHLNRVTAAAESGGASPLIPSTAPSLTTPATSSTGTYTVSWTSVSGALTYNLQKEVNEGSWALVTNTGSTSWGATSQPTGTYGYRVQACDSAGCGPWSPTGTTAVSIPTAPATAPALSVPATSVTGSYTVSWGSVNSAGSYTLQQRINGGAWQTVSASAAMSWNASGEASGSYGYQVQACNAVGCGPWSAVGTDTVTLPPIPATPGLTAPSANATGSYTVSWSSVSNATSYTMQEQINGGGWNAVSASAATSWAASVPNGTYGYRVQACDVTGCSAWSGTSTTVVTIPVPIAINGQYYQEGEQVSAGTGAARIGFAIAGGNTWEVFISNGTLSTSSIAVSGAVPTTAVSVQYTWTLEGVPSGDLDSGGAVINGASSPTALSSNPSSQYTTTAFGPKSVARGETYLLTVTFFNAAGANVSSSTATMTATVVGSE
jgi:YD repeat-containing protein